MQFRNQQGRIIESIDEEYVVPNLLRVPEFKKFYLNERMETLGEICWLPDHNLEPWLRMKSRTDIVCGINYPIIFIRNFPLPIEDACVTAHEIMHLILTEVGKSVDFSYGTEYNDLASALKTMLEDPMINYYLVSVHNFDILPDYKKDINFIREQINNNKNLKEDTIGRIKTLERAFNLACHVLKWKAIEDLISDEAKKTEWENLLVDIENQDPKTSKLSNEVVEIVLGTELDMNEIVKKILKKYNLSSFIHIKLA